MTIFHATYPWAFQTPGGGEIQILKYQEYLRSIDYKYKLHDPWSPLLPKYCSALHFFLAWVEVSTYCVKCNY